MDPTPAPHIIQLPSAVEMTKQMLPGVLWVLKIAAPFLIALLGFRFAVDLITSLIDRARNKSQSDKAKEETK